VSQSCVPPVLNSCTCVFEACIAFALLRQLFDACVETGAASYFCEELAL
jgi:hypothetical protein